MWVNGDLVTNLTPKGFMIKCPAIRPTYGMTGTYFVHQITVGQYTERMDKNGKEIYEGDIVNVSFGRNKLPLEVLMRNGEWAICECGGEMYLSLYDFKQDELEVIGNIHDIPKMIKGGE